MLWNFPEQQGVPRHRAGQRIRAADAWSLRVRPRL